VQKDGFRIGLAQSAADLWAAQRLRYEVFVAELGGHGAGVDHAQRLERDHYDAFADHLLVWDLSTDCVVGAYRLLRTEQAARGPGFYTDTEFDLAPLMASGRSLLELGRSCVHPAYRGGAAAFHLWAGLADYVAEHGCDLLFGTASLPGTDVQRNAQMLSLLHHKHRAHPKHAPRSRRYLAMGLVPEARLDRRRAMIEMPPLVKAYLRLGGQVGDGAYIDHDFNCIDVCMLMDTKTFNAKHARLYRQGSRR